METPERGHPHVRSMRNHTPKLSERKKKLFGTAKGEEVNSEDELLSGIEPLPKVNSKTGNKTPKCTKPVESLMGSYKKSSRVISFFETESEEGDTGEEQKPSPSRRSIRLSLKETTKSESEKSISPHKENIPIRTPTRREAQEAKQLQKMFSNSMQITPRNKSMIVEESSSEDELNSCGNPSNKIIPNKRNCEIVDSTGYSPNRKMAKTVKSPIDGLSISTASFYSAKNRTPQNNSTSRPSCRNLFGQNFTACYSTHSKSKQIPRRSLGLQSTSINRGVHHKVRKRSNNLSPAAKHYAPVDIDQILNNIRNEKLRKLITTKREERLQVEKIHNILRKAANPIAMARPLSIISNREDSNNNASEDAIEQQKSFETHNPITSIEPVSDFSDIECDGEVGNKCERYNSEGALMDMTEEVIPLITHQKEDTFSVKSEESMTLVKRKFFKSGRTTSTRKEVHLTDNIKATVDGNGKISIIPEKKKVSKRFKIRSSVEFSDEQATVDAILRNFDDTAFGDTVLPKDDEAQNICASQNNQFFNDEIDQQLVLMNEGDSSSLVDDIVLQDNQDFYEFRKRLPYNTTDPEMIERQHLLLDFLITNNICTEENFNIFIADPDNHKAEAEKIIDDLVVIVTDHQNTDFRQRIPYNTTDPAVIEQQHYFLDFLLENNICSEENFDIFIANYSQKKEQADAILSQYASTMNGQYTENKNVLTRTCRENDFLPKEEVNSDKAANNAYEYTNNNITLAATNIDTNAPSITTMANTIPQEINNSADQPQQKLFPVFYPGGCQPLPQIFTRRKQRLWNAGFGLNQYQIDAGQKEFGAHQCKQCGLVYTVHEPEEEKLHRDFHASLHILRFKGWIDEDIVAIYPEWGVDGRILRLTEASPVKRRDRLLEILKIVDKELGFSSYVVPKTFVAYLAVRKMQIVGLCLVQPLSKANKYISVNGVDCCTTDQFEAKCGISRIWVSPLHRRLHIGSHLIQAVQLNTIFGEEIPLGKIAFSAPTELGKIFAQTVTKTENFLVYQ